MKKSVFSLFLLLFFTSLAHADATISWYATRSEAEAASSGFFYQSAAHPYIDSSQCVDGLSGGYTNSPSPLAASIWNAFCHQGTVNPCGVLSGATKTWSVPQAGGGIPPQLCVNGCRYISGGISLYFPSNDSAYGDYTANGQQCTGNTTQTEITPSEKVPGTPCSKTTLSNGQLSYDCGTAPATGISCKSTATGYNCKGGTSTAKCWTDAQGTINCTGESVGTVDPSTVIPTEKSTKTNPDGTRNERKVEYLPGGGWKATETTYDAQGNITGTSTESGTGVDNGTDSGGGGTGDGTSNPPPEPPSGTLPSSNITVPGFTSSSFLGASSGCPAPASFTAFGNNYSISFQPMCDFASLVRFLLIAVALFLALRIFQDYVKEAVA